MFVPDSTSSEEINGIFHVIIALIIGEGNSGIQMKELFNEIMESIQKKSIAASNTLCKYIFIMA